MISFSSLTKRRGATLAGIFSLALGSVVLLCGAGSSSFQNLLLQGDLNAGGHSVTNAATLSATNVVVSGSLTAPSSFTLPYSQVTGTPTLGPLSSVSPSGAASSTTFLKFDGTTFSYATPPGTTTSGTSLLYGNGSGGFSNATTGTGLTFSAGALSVTANTYDAFGAAAAAQTAATAAAETYANSVNTTGTAANVTGTVTHGGTGQTTLPSGAILTGNGTGAVSSITPGSGVAGALAFNLDSIGNLASQPTYVAEAYGAKADGQQNNAISITATSATITAGSSIFTSADVGKVILAYQGVVKDNSCTISSSSTTVTMASTAGIYAGEWVAGSSGTLPLGVTVSSVTNSTQVVLSATPNLSGTYTLDFKPTCISTTISSYTSGTQVTLATNMTQTNSAVRIVWGTDNTTAAQNAMNAINAAGGGTLLFNKVGIYCFAGALQETSNRNAVVLLPNGSNKMWVTIKGQGPCNLGDNGILPTQNIPLTGTALFCFTPGSGTNPSLFGGNNAATAGSVSGVDFYVADLGFEMPTEATTGCINILNGGGMILDRVSACTDFPNYSGQFPATATTAFIFANSNNDAIQQARTAEVDGFGTGILGYQHLTLFNTQIAVCNNAMTCNSSCAIYSSHFVANVVDINFGSPTALFAYGVRFEDGATVGSNIVTQYTVTPGSTGSNGYLSYTMITGSFSSNNSANLGLATYNTGAGTNGRSLQSAVDIQGFFNITGTTTDAANRVLQLTGDGTTSGVLLSMITPNAGTNRKGFGLNYGSGNAGNITLGPLSDTGAQGGYGGLTAYTVSSGGPGMQCFGTSTIICSNSSAPTIAAGSGAGSSPTVSILGGNAAGEITITTGSSPSASATVATITLTTGTKTYGSYLEPIIVPENANAAALTGAAALYCPQAGTTSWTISAGSTALAASTTYVYHYYLSGI